MDAIHSCFSQKSKTDFFFHSIINNRQGINRYLNSVYPGLTCQLLRKYKASLMASKIITDSENKF